MNRPDKKRKPGIRLPGRALPESIASAYEVALAVSGGVLLWYAMRLGQFAASPLTGTFPGAAALAANAGIEEAFRLSLALAAAFLIRRLGLRPGLATLGVLASCTMAALENAAYIESFPTLDAYWRLGYALPIHAGAAALYAIATQTLPEHQSRRLVTIAVSFMAAWMWHSAFNITAALMPFPELPLVGTALNLCALAALVVATVYRFGYWSIHENRRI